MIVVVIVFLYNDIKKYVWLCMLIVDILVMYLYLNEWLYLFC